MRIDIPQSSHPITRLVITGPHGTESADFVKGTKVHEHELPEGVDHNEVGIEYHFLNNGNKVVDSGVLKYAIEKPTAPIVPVVDTPADEPVDDKTDDCDCEKPDGCSNCDPADETALKDTE